MKILVLLFLACYLGMHVIEGQEGVTGDHEKVFQERVLSQVLTNILGKQTAKGANLRSNIPQQQYGPPQGQQGVTGQQIGPQFQSQPQQGGQSPQQGSNKGPKRLPGGTYFFNAEFNLGNLFGRKPKGSSSQVGQNAGYDINSNSNQNEGIGWNPVQQQQAVEQHIRVNQEQLNQPFRVDFPQPQQQAQPIQNYGTINNNNNNLINQEPQLQVGPIPVRNSNQYSDIMQQVLGPNPQAQLYSQVTQYQQQLQGGYQQQSQGQGGYEQQQQGQGGYQQQQQGQGGYQQQQQGQGGYQHQQQGQGGYHQQQGQGGYHQQQGQGGYQQQQQGQVGYQQHQQGQGGYQQPQQGQGGYQQQQAYRQGYQEVRPQVQIVATPPQGSFSQVQAPFRQAAPQRQIPQLLPSNTAQTPTESQRFVYLFAPPPEPPTPSPPRRLISPPQKPDKNVQIIFVRAPTPPVQSPVEVILPPPGERKTLVYVMTKTADQVQDNIKFTSPPTQKPPTPEVYFIKYKDAEQPGSSTGQSSTGFLTTPNNNYNHQASSNKSPIREIPSPNLAHSYGVRSRSDSESHYNRNQAFDKPSARVDDLSYEEY